MFCTACGNRIASERAQCSVCGLRTVSANEGRPGGFDRPAGGRGFQRAATGKLLLLVPLSLLVALAGGLLRYDRDLDAKRDAAYLRSLAALESGDFLTAQTGFAALGSYRDAESRLDEVLDIAGPAMQQLAAADAAYVDRDYPSAIALLEEVIATAPGYEPAINQLYTVKLAYRDELLLNVRLAETTRNWLAVEHSLQRAAQLFPEDATIRSELTTIWNEHSPLVYTRDGIVFLGGPSGEDERSLTADIGARWPAWNPDRTRIAFIVPTEGGSRFDGTIMVMDADGTGLSKLVDRVLPFGPATWSPDGMKIAYASVKEFNEDQFAGRISLQLFDLETGLETDLTGSELSHASGATWSPDGTHVAFVSFIMQRRRGGGVDLLDGDAYVVDIKSRELTNITHGMIRDENWIRWSPSGDKLAVLTNPGDWSDPKMMQLYIMNADGSGVGDPIAEDWQLSLPSWSPDGTRLAYVTGGEYVRIWSESGEEWLHVSGKLSPFVSWSPDGATLFAPTGSSSQASYLISVHSGFGTVHEVRFYADGMGGGDGAPMWAPATAPASGA